MQKCSICGNEYNPQQTKKEVIKPVEVRHSHNGQILTDKVVPYDDAFFEIVSGKYKGNLVHRWNIVK